MRGYLISIMRPTGYQHSDAFQEVAETLLYGLQRLGHDAAILENSVEPRANNIVLGAHLLGAAAFSRLPKGTIVYNLEQLGASHLHPYFYEQCRRLQIWDYSLINVARWRELGCVQEPLLVRVGYAPLLRRIEAAPVQDIDILFYGSLNEHRMAILRGLEAAGARVHRVFGLYGKERDARIARSKIVLNLHMYEAKLFEAVRVSYLLANSKAVVSEDSPDMGGYSEAVAVFPLEGFIEGCMALLRDDARRAELEACGFRYISQQRIEDILAQVLPPAQIGEGLGGSIEDAAASVTSL